MYKAYDFVYDGKSSVSEGLKLLNIDGSSFSFEQLTSDKEYELYHTNKSGKWQISGVKVSEPFSFPIQFLFHDNDEDEYEKRNPAISRNELSKYNHWLFNQTKFKKLQIICDDLRDYYFFAVFKNVQHLIDGGKIIGFKADILCDGTGAHEEHIIKKKVDILTSFNILCSQDGIFEVAPTYEITIKSNDIRMEVNKTPLILANCTEDSVVTIDTEKLMCTSSVGDEMYTSGRFNKCFPRFKYGNNYVSIVGDCDIKITYNVTKEVGQ